MDELHAILADHRPKTKAPAVAPPESSLAATTSAIPDIFFDAILKEFKLGRIEIMALMHIYRQIWCRPNMYQIYGISPLMSHTEMAKSLAVSLEEIYPALRKLEDVGLLETIRSGQYFMRKYFTAHYDELFGQNYDDFGP